MATAINLTSTYAGKAATNILTPMFEPLLAYKEAMTIYPNIDFKMPLVRMKTTNVFKTPTQKFTGAGAVTVDERVLFPQPVETQMEVNKLALRGSWNAETLKSAQNGKLPQAHLDALNKNVMGNCSHDFMRLLWVGTTVGAADPINGLYTQLAASVTVKKPGTPSAVDAANIYAKLEELQTLAGVVIWSKPGVTRYFVSSDVASIYRLKVASTSSQRDTTAAIPSNYLGFEIIEVRQLPANTIILANKESFNVGFNEEDGMASLNIIDKEFTTGDKELAVTAGFSIDCKLAFDEEIAMHAFTPAP